jgi:DNA-damage-inducible protein D
MAEQKKPNFDSIKQTNVYGSEYWSARDLMPLLGYDKWELFEGAIKRAMKACEQADYNPDTHFPSAGKVVQLGSVPEREVKDYHLSRFACYLIAQNGDPRKPEVAAAQAYFAVSTRKNELHELYKEEQERLATRLKVSDSYKALGEAAGWSIHR